jgi:hypothetical protein
MIYGKYSHTENMEMFRTLSRREKRSELVLFILFIIYILFNIRTPYYLASYVDTVGGYIVVIGLFILLCKSVSVWAVAALGAVAMIIFVQRSRVSTGTAAMSMFLPGEVQKNEYFSNVNELPVTLEEEMVQKMAPFQGHIADDGTYKPILNDTHDAVRI